MKSDLEDYTLKHFKKIFRMSNIAKELWLNQKFYISYRKYDKILAQ